MINVVWYTKELTQDMMRILSASDVMIRSVKIVYDQDGEKRLQLSLKGRSHQIKFATNKLKELSCLKNTTA